jgi:MFS family permease
METKYIVLTALILAYILVAYLFSLLGARREIGRKRLFWVSLFLTPVIGLAFFLSSQHRKLNMYTEERFKCEACGYVFSEHHDYCPICEKEGHQHALKPVNMYMT